MRNFNIIKTSTAALALMGSFLITSCNPTIDSLVYELPEANSKADLTPPTASFAATVTADYLTYNFANTSSSATEYSWNYGDGKTSTDIDGKNTFPGEGTFTVTLTAKDKLGKTNMFTTIVNVVKPIIPPSIDPTVLNGDFTLKTSDWKISSFTGGNTNPFNASSDGSSTNYDGSDNGGKTAGAKWTSSTSAGTYLSSSSRFAYQELIVSPNKTYVLEFEYAIKSVDEDSDVAPGGNRLIGEILDGHFTDGADALASSNAGPLARYIGSANNGKTSFAKVTKVFTSNATGKISIWLYGITAVDSYIDNVKVYPAQ